MSRLKPILPVLSSETFIDRMVAAAPIKSTANVTSAITMITPRWLRAPR